jgi:hypothetical protein
VYLVADDDAGNMQTSPRRLAVETTDITPPALEAGTETQPQTQNSEPKSRNPKP